MNIKNNYLEAFEEEEENRIEDEKFVEENVVNTQKPNNNVKPVNNNTKPISNSNFNIIKPTDNQILSNNVKPNNIVKPSNNAKPDNNAKLNNIVKLNNNVNPTNILKPNPNQKTNNNLKPNNNEKPGIKNIKKKESDIDFIYTDPVLKELCENPNITAADSNLNGSQIILFKKNKYYILEGQY